MSDWLSSLPGVLTTLLVLLEIGVVVAALGVIPGNRRPSTGMAWLILVIAVPLFGLLAFLLFGSTRVEREAPGEAAAGQRHHPWPGPARSPSWARPGPSRRTSPPSPSSTVGSGRCPRSRATVRELFPDYVESIAAMARGGRHG